MEEDLITLQEMAAHQQEEIARLSEELYIQQKEITALRTELASLRTMVKAAFGEGFHLRSQQEETPPPHY